MKIFEKSVRCSLTVLLFLLANLSVSAASEPQILLKTEKIGSHDWSKKPPMLSGFDFKTVDIDKAFADESGKRQESALKWKSMISNKRHFDDYEIENRIVEYVTGPSRFGFVGVFIFEGENRVLPADRRICSERVESINKKFGSASVLKDKSSGEWEQIKAQWLVGNAIADFACTHFASEVESGFKKTVIEFSTLGADFVDRVKQLTPLVALKCDFSSAVPRNNDGTSYNSENSIDAFSWELLIDIDTSELKTLSGTTLDRNASVDANNVTAGWTSGDGELLNELKISRLNGSATYTGKLDDSSVQHQGQCKKIDLTKKLF